MSLAIAISCIDELLEPHRMKDLVAAFYDRPSESDSVPSHFVGSFFTSLPRSDVDAFDAADLLAVHLMGMTFRPTAVRHLLEPGPAREEVSGLLHTIRDVDIWKAEDADLAAANELWRVLAKDEKGTYPGINYVTAGKLLARKRPRLIPIVDSVIERLVPEPSEGYWQLFRAYLSVPERLEKVEELRPPGAGPDTKTPTLRLLDTALWMRGSRGPAGAIRERLGIPEVP